jgi:YHS domain-containing protein
VQGPEPYLNDLGIHFPCVVDRTKNASIDARHRAFVNYEVYYVSSDEALKAFVAAPYKFVGKITDPVSHHRFRPTAGSPRRSFQGRLFYLESAETATTFDSAPETYGVFKPTMAMK